MTKYAASLVPWTNDDFYHAVLAIFVDDGGMSSNDTVFARMLVWLILNRFPGTSSPEIDAFVGIGYETRGVGRLRRVYLIQRAL